MTIHERQLLLYITRQAQHRPERNRAIQKIFPSIGGRNEKEHNRAGHGRAYYANRVHALDLIFSKRVASCVRPRSARQNLINSTRVCTLTMWAFCKMQHLETAAAKIIYNLIFFFNFVPKIQMD